MKKQLIHLDDIAALDTLLDKSVLEPVLLFKHSSSCPLSAFAFHQLIKYLENHPSQLMCGLVIVQHARNVSNEIAKRLNIRHESPQAILVANRQVIWHDSHNKITVARLVETVRQYAPARVVEERV